MYSSKYYHVHKLLLKLITGELEIEEIEEMIEIVDKNKDGKISYSEFRVRIRNHILERSNLLGAF